MQAKYYLFFVTLLYIYPSMLFPQEKVDGEIIQTNYTTDTINHASTDYIKLYQDFISKHKNGKCAMYPSCSNYGLMVLDKYPIYKALPMIADRVIRCSHDAQFYDTTYEYGHKSILDYPFNDELSHTLAYKREIEPQVDVLQRRTYRLDEQFIHHLINRKLYEPALAEIERLQFYGNQEISLYHQKLLCYRGLNRYEDGIFEYENNYALSLKSDAKIALQAAILYDNVENAPLAEQALNHIKEWNDTTSYYRSIVYKAYLQTKQKKYQKAKQTFLHADDYKSEIDIHASENLQLLKQIQESKYKSPTLARILSIIPGGGYLYTKHTGSAITSLVMNSLLAYATYTSIKSENYGVAGLCGFLSLSFYFGNINGAGRSAVRYNEKIHCDYTTRIYNANKLFIY